ncbi:hypothetical protein Kisp01_12580 [Kineosporia sp. NBRC 101677]|nr:hypothetical protein Kisp01_12580 [Kineosporia sp. NBRC 101677]
MFTRTARAGLAVLATLGATVSALALAAGPASAKTAAECQITGMYPSGKIAVGPNGKEVTFRMDSNCPAGSKIAWYYIAQYPPNVPHSSTFPLYMFANYEVSTASHFQVQREGVFTLSSGLAGNELAGVPIEGGVTAFVDTGAPDHQDEEYLEGFSSNLTLLRATRITGFTADKSTVNSGEYITFSGNTQRANWETHKWRTFDSHGDSLQFRPEGSNRWTSLGTDVTTHQATVSGDYRMHYAGDDWSGSSVSKVVHVTVN